MTQGGSFFPVSPLPQVVFHLGKSLVFKAQGCVPPVLWELCTASGVSGSADKASTAFRIRGWKIATQKGLLGPCWPFELFAYSYSRKAICRVEIFLVVD